MQSNFSYQEYVIGLLSCDVTETVLIVHVCAVSCCVSCCICSPVSCEVGGIVEWDRSYLVAAWRKGKSCVMCSTSAYVTVLTDSVSVLLLVTPRAHAQQG